MTGPSNEKKDVAKKNKKTPQKTQTTQIRTVVLSSDLDFRIKQIKCNSIVPFESHCRVSLRSSFLLLGFSGGEKNLRPQQGLATPHRRGSSAVMKGLSDLCQCHRSANYHLTFTDFLIFGAPTWCWQPDQHCKLTKGEITPCSALSWRPEDRQLWTFQLDPRDLTGP